MKLEWVELSDSNAGNMIEVESEKYDYTITPRNRSAGYTLRRYVFDSDQLLDVVPCFDLESAKSIAQKWEDIACGKNVRM